MAESGGVGGGDTENGAEMGKGMAERWPSDEHVKKEANI